MIAISIAGILLLIYSLIHVSRDSAEFVISVITMALCVLLIAAALYVDFRLRRSIRKKNEELRAQMENDKADPWILG